jgi:hypothetical protein
MPAFNVFKWETGVNALAGKYDLVFWSENGEVPSPEAIALALLVVINQTKLATLVANALWEDINGHGPSSGMWWHGNLERIAKDFDHALHLPLSNPNDLQRGLRFHGVAIKKKSFERTAPIANLPFAAVFEEEHGVGVITNGNAIVGMSYSTDFL